MQRPHNKRRNILYVSRALSKPLTPFVFSQGSVWRPAVQSLTQESDSQKWLTWNVWLWGHWTLGMSEWITPCNTWHRLFYLPGYCCWHKAMPAACDPRWHRMMRRDMQAFWSSSPERVSGTEEQCCLSGTSLQLQWQSVLSMEQCSLMGQFHKKMDWVKMFFSSFFSPHFSGSLGKMSKSRRSRCYICLHNHSTEHWGFKRDLYALPTHSVVTH